MSNIQEKIDYLNGTCNSINLDDFTVAELEVLDEQIFECSTCNWWWDIEDEVSEGTDLQCRDCKEEEI